MVCRTILAIANKIKLQLKKQISDNRNFKKYNDKYIYLRAFPLLKNGKLEVKIGITNNPNRRDSEQNVLPVPSQLLKIISMPNKKIAEKIEKELLEIYFAKKKWS